MVAALLGIYIAVEKMDITPIATAKGEYQLADPMDTSTSFGCTSELYVDESKESWVKNYNGDFFRLKNPNDFGTQWYCIEAGGRINGIYNMTYPDLYDAYNETTEDHYSCGHGASCPGSEVPIHYSCPYFLCVGNHYTQDSSYTNYGRSDPKTGSTPWRQSNLYNVAYILSYKNSDDLMYEIDQETYAKTYQIMEPLPDDDPDGWSGAKQHAVWKSIVSDNIKTDSQLQSYHKEFVKQGAKLYDEASAFRKYYSYIKNVQYPDDGSVDQYPAYVGEKEVGFGLKDQTNNDGVYTFVDQEPQEAKDKVKYTIGPFKINYVNGTMAIMWLYLGGSQNPYEIGFSGMTEAYLLDDKGNRIEINRFIITKSASGQNYSPHLQLKPEYFKTLNEDGSQNVNLVDRYACKYKNTDGNHIVFNESTGEGQGYPFPREEFYIEFYATKEMSTKVKVHMDFKWLDASMQICLKEGRKYYSYFSEIRGGGNCDYIIDWYPCDCDEFGCSSCPIYCNARYNTHVMRVDRSHYVDQQDNMEVVSEERVLHDESIELDNGGKYFDLTMQIGGFVWEDMNEYSKQGASVDGEYKDGDNPYQGIEVILHEYGQNNNKFVRRTVTDENGYYMFKDVDSRKKYYVEFVFDGQKFENTIYTPYQLVVNGKIETTERPWKPELYKIDLYEIKDGRKIYKNTTTVDQEGNYMFTDDDLDYYKQYNVKIIKKGETIKEEQKVAHVRDTHHMSNATETTDTGRISGVNQATNDKTTLNARNQYNKRFEEIGSYPENYLVRNPLKARLAKQYQVGEYNKTYSWTKMEKGSDGKYQRVETDVAKIYDKVRTVASEYAKLMDADNRVGRIQDPYTEAYKTVAGEMTRGFNGKTYTAEETASILQFLEDRRMSAYTGEDGLVNHRYFVFEEYNGKFVIATRNEVDDKGTPNNLASTGIHRGDGKIQIGSTVYSPIYDGAYRDYSVTKYREYIDARRKPSNRAKDNEIKIASQLRIDYGITRRLFTDTALSQDLFKVTTKINGKTQVYDYNVREVGEDDFHIEQRVDSGDYYNIKHDRGLYKSDWLYSADMYQKNELNPREDIAEALKGLKDTTELEVYATYRVTINNQGNTNVDIQELVDYYDEEYIFEPNLSFTVYNDGKVDKDNFHDAMHNSTLVNRGGTTALTTYENGADVEDYIESNVHGEGTGTKGVLKEEHRMIGNYSLGSSIEYSDRTQIENYSAEPAGYDSLYFTTTQGTQIAPGAKMYAYLTFRVKRAGEGARVILDETEVEAKHNVTEINGYNTYYHENTILPRYDRQNNYKTRANQIAGVIDTDSTPGNVTAKVPAGKKHTIDDVTAYEDDTDKARDFTVRLYTDPRKMNGTVWEDERTNGSSNAMVGDGVFLTEDTDNQKAESPIDGVTVQLVELIDKGNGEFYEYIWKEVASGDDMREAVLPGADAQGSGAERGRYEFNNFITGNYIVRFKYGDTYATVLSNGHGNYTADKDKEATDAIKINDMLGGARNATSYNGQDYKSTAYQVNVTQKEEQAKEDEEAGTTGIGQSEVSTADPVKVYAMNHEGNTQYSSLYGYVDYYGDMNNYGQNTTGSYVYDIGASDNGQRVSDAKDIYIGSTQQYDSRTEETTETGGHVSGLNRADVIDYSDNLVTNHKAEVMASPYEIPTYKDPIEKDDMGEYKDNPYSETQMRALVDELIKYTQMRAETGIIDVEYEYNRRVSDAEKEENSTIDGEIHFGAGAGQVNKDNTNKGYTNGNDKNGTYVLADIDFGLQQRPQAQLELDKRVNNVKVTLANGSVLFDANQKATNVLWQSKGENTVTRTEPVIRNVLGMITKGNVVPSSDKGKIQLTMDEEIMHGATIQITYKLEVENTGEIDYNDMKFYYTSTIDRANKATTLVQTKVDELVDYINNNMEYRQVDNEYIDDENTNKGSPLPQDKRHNKWEVIQKTVDGLSVTEQGKAQALMATGSDFKTNPNLINVNLTEQVNEFNTIVHVVDSPILDWLDTYRRQDDATKSYADREKADESTRTIQLLLTQTLDPESDTDEMTYANIAEIAKTSNTVGRRMAVSVVGNQNPEEEIAEVDADISEDVVILPPFGDDQSKIAIWSIVGVVALLILGGGIILIKKFVLKK